MTKDNPKEQSLTPEYPDSPTVEADNCESSKDLTGAKAPTGDGTDFGAPRSNLQQCDGTNCQSPHSTGSSPPRRK